MCPERHGSQVARCHSDFPLTWKSYEYLPDGLRRHSATTIFSRHEELPHVVLHAATTMGKGVDQGKAGQRLPEANQQRPEAFDQPIAFEVRKRGIATLIVEFDVAGVRGLHLR